MAFYISSYPETGLWGIAPALSRSVYRRFGRIQGRDCGRASEANQIAVRNRTRQQSLQRILAAEAIASDS